MKNTVKIQVLGSLESVDYLNLPQEHLPGNSPMKNMINCQSFAPFIKTSPFKTKERQNILTFNYRHQSECKPVLVKPLSRDRKEPKSKTTVILLNPSIENTTHNSLPCNRTFPHGILKKGLNAKYSISDSFLDAKSKNLLQVLPKSQKTLSEVDDLEGSTNASLSKRLSSAKID